MKISGSQKSSPGGNHALQTRDLHLWQLQHQHHWRMGFSHHITTKAKSALFLGVGCIKIIFLNDDTLIYYSTCSKTDKKVANSSQGYKTVKQNSITNLICKPPAISTRTTAHCHPQQQSILYTCSWQNKYKFFSLMSLTCKSSLHLCPLYQCQGQ